jgi:hypothetical protein
MQLSTFRPKQSTSPLLPVVIAGLDPAIHLTCKTFFHLMDARIKSGHDDRDWIAGILNRKAAAGSNWSSRSLQHFNAYFLL